MPLNLPPEVATHLQHAAGAALARAIDGMSQFVSGAIGEEVQVTSGAAGQIVISPTDQRLPKHPEKRAAKLILPLLLGAAMIELTREDTKP